MKTTFIIMLLLAAFYCEAQTLSAKQDPVPPYLYIMPDLNRTQLDSVIQYLKQWNIELKFETLEYDPATNMIVKASGKVINKHLAGNKSDATFHSENFTGLTIITTEEKCGVVVGIAPVPRER